MELLSPAGNRERLEMALLYGADAVYLAGQQFGMRAAAGNFDDTELPEAVRLAHEKNVKVYVTCNTVPRNGEMAALPEHLRKLERAGADGLIISDMGVLRVARRTVPGLPVHVSTQAGVMNSECANMLYELGARRVVLAREMTLAEIRDLRREIPEDMEIEVFVHGAMCVSFSGRCLLSNYLTGRDSNRGECAQPCRWKYKLVEETRPGEYFDITEDGGTFIMNSRDLCMIDRLAELREAGVNSVKIEGRMKSAYYVAAVTNAYRHVLDAVNRGEEPARVWLDEVNKVSHRAYSTGFYYGAEGPGQNYGSASYYADTDVMAQVLSCDADGNAVLSQRNKFSLGDRLELMTPDHEPAEFPVTYMENGDGESIVSTPHPTMEIRMKLPFAACPNSFLRKKR